MRFIYYSEFLNNLYVSTVQMLSYNVAYFSMIFVAYMRYTVNDW